MAKNSFVAEVTFKYIWVVCYLKLRFYCLACSTMLDLNSADSQHRTVTRNFNS